MESELPSPLLSELKGQSGGRRRQTGKKTKGLNQKFPGEKHSLHRQWQQQNSTQTI